jgi:glycosyltransferase involved in cell wall biosynthesis
MDNRIPPYSVLMSVYAKEKPEYLKCSIQSMLDQTVPADEFVLVEDGPLPDELKSVIAGFVKDNPGLFHIISLPKNMGLGSALARGIQECRNEFIARMDSDDYSVPERCEKELDCFLKEPNLDMVACNVKEFKEDLSDVTTCRIMPETQDEIIRYSRRRCPLIHPTVIYKKSAVLRSGNYRQIRCEDYDLFLRMLQNNCQCYNLQEFLLYFRINRGSYERRGGMKYMKTMISFRKDMYRHGLCSIGDFLISAGAQCIVCLLPGSVRGALYRNLLRNKV